MHKSVDRAVEAAHAASAKLLEEHRRSGEPLVISPDPSRIQWVIPQEDGTLKVVKERLLTKDDDDKEDS